MWGQICCQKVVLQENPRPKIPDSVRGIVGRLALSTILRGAHRDQPWDEWRASGASIIGLIEWM